MMIAMNTKSHVESRKPDGSSTPPGQYPCLSPSPPASPSEINSSIYSSEPNMDEKETEKNVLRNPSDEYKRKEQEMSNSTEVTAKIGQGNYNCILVVLFRPRDSGGPLWPSSQAASYLLHTAV